MTILEFLTFLLQMSALCRVGVRPIKVLAVRHRPSMTVIKMPPVNVGSCVTAFMQVSADGCKGNGSGPSWTAREVVGGDQ